MIKVAAVVLLAATSLAHADDAGDKLLVGMEAKINAFKTLKLDIEATNTETGKTAKTLGLKVLSKGEKRYVEFGAPADMKGTKVLVLSATQMYVYLPAFGKVRRIASHTKDQGFMGMALTSDDFGAEKYSGQYSAAMGTSTDSESIIVLTPKSGQDTSYAKIEFRIEKKTSLPIERKAYNAEGKVVQTDARKYSCESNVCAITERTVTSGAITTKLVVKARKINEDISDDTFTQRNMGQ